MHRPDDESLNELTQALAGLPPAPIGFRDRLMFEAGRADARPRRRWLWPGATALTMGVAACLGVALALQPAPTPVTHTVYVERRLPEPVREPPALPESAPATLASSS